MTDINSVNVVGRLTRDIGTDQYSFGYLQNGTAKAQVSIAVNRAKKQGEQWTDEVSFFDVVIWGKTAENLKPYLTKGKQIAVSGHLHQDRWEKDGQKFSKVVIVADNVQLCGGRDDGGSLNPNRAYPSAEAARQADAQYSAQSQFGQPPQGYAPRNSPPQTSFGLQDGGFPEDIPW